MTAAAKHPATFQRMLMRRLESLLARMPELTEPFSPALKDQILHVLQYGLSCPASWPTTRQLLLVMAPRMEQAGHRDDWMAYLRAGLELCDEHQDRRTKAALAYHLGYISQIRGQYGAAIEHLRLSADLYADLGDATGHAEALNRLAYVARLQGRSDDAVELARQALAMLDDHAFGRQFSYFTLGAVKLDQEDWAAAVNNFDAALEICRAEPGAGRLTALRLGNLGTAYYYWQRYADARHHFEEAVTLFRQLGDVAHTAVMEMNLGNVYLDEGYAHQALALYTRAADVLHAIHDEHHLGLLYLNYGRAYRELSKLDLSEQYLVNSVARWQASEHAYLLANTLYELGLTYRAAQRDGQALEQFHAADAVLKQNHNDHHCRTLRQEILAAITASTPSP